MTDIKKPCFNALKTFWKKKSASIADKSVEVVGEIYENMSNKQLAQELHNHKS